MKRIASLLVVFIIGAGFKAVAQDFPIDSTTKKIDFVEVVQAPGLTKSVLFDRALVALHKIYKQADTKIVVKDKDNGIIVLNGFTQVQLKGKNGTMMQSPELILYKLTISFKDGKYRYEITEFQQNRAGVPMHIERWIEHNVPGDHTFGPEDRIQEHLDYLFADIHKVIQQLKTGMLGEKSVEKKDW